MHIYTYLALGDSYTIGESLPLHKSFPYQTVCLLRKAGYMVAAPEIIARTGWTTDDLESGTKEFIFSPKYDFVTLLIGVNNQYRGRNIIEYKEQFESLLKKGIAYAGGKPDHVAVLSIPDYSVTPYAENKNPENISKEIDEYNTLNKAISIQYKVQYLEITESSRKAKSTSGLVAPDGLHPSEKEYAKWAKQLVQMMKQKMKK
jgi:lysophospholipase L1-like esterase